MAGLTQIASKLFFAWISLNIYYNYIPQTCQNFYFWKIDFFFSRISYIYITLILVLT